MSDIPIVGNPLGWGQLQLVGGWRRFWMLAGMYAGGILFIGVLIYRGTQPDLSITAFAGGALTLLIFVQAGLFFLFGTNQIRRVIQRDFTSDMITSHRLTAMSGATAVLGYLTGSLSQVAAMTLVNWVACNVFMFMIGPGPGQSPYAPTMLFIAMGVLAVTCWTFAVLVALATRGKTAIAGLLVILAVGSNLTVTAALPGLYLTLAIARLAMITQAKMQPIDQNFVFVSMAFQLLLAAVFFLAAARKYHRDDVSAFTPPLACVLLGLCTLACAVALRFWPPDANQVWHFFAFASDPTIQWVVTLAALALLACLPVAAAAREEARWVRRQEKDPAFAPQRPRVFYEAAIFSTLVVFTILILVMGRAAAVPFVSAYGEIHWGLALSVVISFLLAMLTLSGMLRYGYSITPSGTMFGGLVVFLLWFMPLIADMMIEVLYERLASDPPSILFVISPVGTWTAALRGLSVPIGLGLVVQAALAVFALMVARRAKGAASPAV